MSRGLFAIILICCAPAWGGLLSSCERFQIPSESRVVIVFDNMMMNNVPMAASELHSRLSPKEVLDFYRGIWTAKSQKVELTQMGEWETVATESQGCFYTVQVRPAAGNGAYALLGVTNPAAITSTVLGQGFPNLSGSTIVNDMKFNDAGKLGRTLVLTNPSSPDMVANFYMNALRADRWTAVSQQRLAPGGSAQIIQIWKRGTEESHIVIAAKSGITNVVVNVVSRP